jgi:hypothetical protein
MMASTSSGTPPLYSKLSVITLCSDILLLIEKPCCVALSTITKSVKIQLALTLVIIQIQLINS